VAVTFPAISAVNRGLIVKSGFRVRQRGQKDILANESGRLKDTKLSASI